MCIGMLGYISCCLCRLSIYVCVCVCVMCTGGMGIGATVSNTLRHPDFLKSPAKAASYVWEKSG